MQNSEGNIDFRLENLPNSCNSDTFSLLAFLVRLVEPHYPVKREGGLEKTSIHWHTVAYANTNRADGRVEAILPE